MKNYTAAVTRRCSVADGLNLNVAELQPVSKIHILNYFSVVPVLQRKCALSPALF